jgi:hypothetical protein
MEMDTWTLRLVVSSERDQNRLGRRRQIPALALPANGNAFLLPTSVSCSSHYPSHLHPTSLSYPSSPVRIAAPTSGDAHPPRKTGPLCPIRAIQTRQDTTITQTRLPSSLHRTTLTLINRVNPTHIPLLLNTNFRPRRTHLRLRPRRTPTRPHTPSRRRSTSTRIRLITRNPADSILCRTTPTHLSQRIIHLRNPTSNLSTKHTSISKAKVLLSRPLRLFNTPPSPRSHPSPALKSASIPLSSGSLHLHRSPPSPPWPPSHHRLPLQNPKSLCVSPVRPLPPRRHPNPRCIPVAPPPTSARPRRSAPRAAPCDRRVCRRRRRSTRTWRWTSKDPTWMERARMMGSQTQARRPVFRRVLAGSVRNRPDMLAMTISRTP